MVCLLVVRPFYKNNVMKLASHFIKTRYMEGSGVLYVAIEDNKGKTKLFTPKITSTWSPHWIGINEEFECMFGADPILSVFVEKYSMYGMVTIGFMLRCQS
jgi:hypothetical protein